MIIFKTVTFRNFMSYGDYDTTIDLSSHSSTIIVGKNGNGKSVLIEVVSYALFGKPYRKVSKEQLVNSINGKACRVTLEFTIGVNNYTIVRGMKPNIFEIYQNGKLLNQESHNKDYQKILELNILKFNQKTFNQVVVLGSANFIPFMQLPTGVRREIIEDLLDITIFSKMNILLKTEIANLKEQLTDVEYKKKLIEERISLTSVHIEKLSQLQQESDSRIVEEIKTLKEEIKTLHGEYNVKKEEGEKLYKLALDKITKTRKKISTLDSYKAGINEKIKNAKRHSSFYTNNHNCPTCSQVIPVVLKEQKIAENTQQENELSDGLSKLIEEIEKVEGELKIYSEELEDARTIQDNSRALLVRMESLSEQIIRLEEQRNDSKGKKDLTAERENLQSMWEEKSKIESLRSDYIDQRAYNEVLSELLKDTGIKTKITKQYIPVINTLVNKYLQILDFFVLFNLDENFNETIKSRHRDDFTYASFSEGEKQRIDLALLFTWRHIAHMKNSISTNLLIFDELVDGSMDQDGIDSFFKILNSLENETNVFVISHRADILEGKFANRIEVTKTNNFSRLK